MLSINTKTKLSCSLFFFDREFFILIIYYYMISEYKAILDRDPAATKTEALLMPGLHALIVHKHITHPLYIHRIRFVARLVSQIMRGITGIEFHP